MGFYWDLLWWSTGLFPYIGNNHPNWLSYFSEGLKPPTRLFFVDMNGIDWDLSNMHGEINEQAWETKHPTNKQSYRHFEKSSDTQTLGT